MQVLALIDDEIDNCRKVFRRPLPEQVFAWPAYSTWSSKNGRMRICVTRTYSSRTGEQNRRQ